MLKLKAILYLYKSVFFLSVLVNVLILLFNKDIAPLIITKLALTVFMWYIFNETDLKHRLIFYKNLGISTFSVFSLMFIFDMLFTILFRCLFIQFL